MITENLEYESIYEQNPKRKLVTDKIRTEFSKEVEEYHKDFVTSIQRLILKARELNLPIKIRPEMNTSDLYLINERTVDLSKIYVLRQMFEEAVMFEPNYL